MKIALAQLNFHIGNFDTNFEKMAAAVADAQAGGADLVVFSELATCGYPPRDFLEFNDFIRRSKEVIAKLLPLSNEIGIVVGAPSVNPKAEGKDLFNSAYLLYEGKVQHTSHKALLPTYDIFDEYRYFEPHSEFSVAEFTGRKIAFTICEDIWNIGNENPLYAVCPMDELLPQQPDLMINLSASPFDYKHAEERIAVVKANANRYNLPVIYVNQVGAQTEVIFDGGSLVVDADGELIEELVYFEEALRIFDLDDLKGGGEQKKEKFALIHDALILGIRDYFGKLGFNKAILGLSGGVDSALTLALAAEALGPENVLSVMLPSEYSSDHSVNDSVRLCENLGSPYKKISIHDSYSAALSTMEPHFEGRDFNVAEENMQARMRGLILMALSNKFGYILLNTSNKSEAAVGYGTLYGDMAGGLSVIGDLYKVEVYDLCRYINRNGEIIPEHILTKAPSAELRPDQKDSDSLPPYNLLDQVLYQYIEMRKGPKEIEAMGFDAALVKRVLQLVNRSEYKRYQTAPMLRVSSKAFGMGRRMPIVARYLG